MNCNGLINMLTVYVWRFSVIQVMSVSSVLKVSPLIQEASSVQNSVVYCCVGVRLPRRVIGSRSMMRIVAATMLRQAQYRTLDKSAAKPQGFPLKMNGKHCVFVAESNLV